MLLDQNPPSLPPVVLRSPSRVRQPQSPTKGSQLPALRRDLVHKRLSSLSVKWDKNPIELLDELVKYMIYVIYEYTAWNINTQ